MKIVGAIAAFAPMPTGHPLGLPGDVAQNDTPTRIGAAKESDRSNLSPDTGLSNQSQASSRQRREDSNPDANPSEIRPKESRAPNDAPSRMAGPVDRLASEDSSSERNSASQEEGGRRTEAPSNPVPPTIMQLKINELLQAQVDARKEADAAEIERQTQADASQASEVPQAPEASNAARSQAEQAQTSPNEAAPAQRDALKSTDTSPQTSGSATSGAAEALRPEKPNALAAAKTETKVASENNQAQQNKDQAQEAQAAAVQRTTRPDPGAELAQRAVETRAREGVERQSPV